MNILSSISCLNTTICIFYICMYYIRYISCLKILQCVKWIYILFSVWYLGCCLYFLKWNMLYVTSFCVMKTCKTLDKIIVQRSGTKPHQKFNSFHKSLHKYNTYSDNAQAKDDSCVFIISLVFCTSFYTAKSVIRN